MILDEPNANLDGHGDAALLKALWGVKQRGATLIVIAHRPSILEVVDKILVLREGTMAQFGDRESVLWDLSIRSPSARRPTRTRSGKSHSTHRSVSRTDPTGRAPDMARKREKTEKLPPTNVRPAIVFGMAVILFGLGSFGAWASISQLSSAIIGPGVVKVVSERKIVQSASAGTISDILVGNGTRVAAGDVLMRMDDTAAKAALSIIQSNFDLKQATIARLQAERDHAETISFPKGLLALEGDPDVADLLASQRQLFESEHRALEGQTGLIREQIRQFGEQINGLRAQAEAISERIAITEREYADMQALLKKNLVANSRCARS